MLKSNFPFLISYGKKNPDMPFTKT